MESFAYQGNDNVFDLEKWKKAHETLEPTPENIAAAEAELQSSIDNFEGEMSQPGNWEVKNKEKGWKSLRSAEQLALSAFGLLGAPALYGIGYAGEKYNDAQAALQDGDFEKYTTLIQRVQEAQTETEFGLAAAVAVPLLILGISKVSRMLSKKA